ncbi:hypothetical protein [Campylobacter molothri]|uniref:hypothetical protein n=1 Tax=Campylobacter molothri TaxID=1032242 RepID=UPI001EFA77BC|nr:hypothetical protein [Campylobacter sp. RM10537]MBZ7949699.1 hypothetical protein [Campylobacter sp. RM10534]ULO00159.1 hypothetical protein CMOL_1007 [Campylobacter sp. RM10537]
MLIAKKTLSDQGKLNINVIKWAIETKTELALLTRNLKIDIDKSNQNNTIYIDNITPEEIQAGTNFVKEYCLANNELELLKQYLPIVLQDNELLIEMKNLKLIKINQSYEISISQVQKEYIPVTEMLTFETQERESLEYKKNGYSDDNVCPTMKAISISRGMNLKDLCDKAILKATLYRQAIGGLIGKRQGLQDKIEQAKTLEELESIVWSD